MATLWQMFKGWLKKKKEVPPSQSIYNPLNAKIESSVQFDILDMRGKTFFVKEIRENDRKVSGKSFKFTDYTLLCRTVGGEDEWVRLRLMPIKNAAKGDISHNTIVLSLYDKFPFNKDFLEIAQDKEFVTDDNNAHYWRINDVVASYHTKVSVLTENESLSKLNIEYWDFWRETKDEANQDFNEFIFVEKDDDDGMFEIWKGLEINASRLSVL